MKTKEQYDKIVSDRGGATHWDQQLENKYNPQHAALLKEASTFGSDQAKRFRTAAVDPAHPNSENAKKMFKKYPGPALEQFCTSQAQDRLGVKPIEERNKSYEQKVKGGYVAKTAKDVDNLKTFRDTLSAKHLCQGYANDAEDIQDYFNKNPMSK